LHRGVERDWLVFSAPYKFNSSSEIGLKREEREWKEFELCTYSLVPLSMHLQNAFWNWKGVQLQLVSEKRQIISNVKKRLDRRREKWFRELN